MQNLPGGVYYELGDIHRKHQQHIQMITNLIVTSTVDALNENAFTD